MTSTEQNDTFNRWMEDHAAILHKVARSFCHAANDQEDLLQEIRVALWHGIPGYDGRSKVSSYIYRICLNKAISWKRRAQSYRRKIDKFENEPIAPPDVTGSTDRRLAIVYAEIRRLNDAERSLILLQLDGFNYREIAETLGLTESNVGVKLNRIRKKLAERLKGQNP
ncbi:MAG: RNA polymerase sigma factor [Synoicihabitans sp.]